MFGVQSRQDQQVWGRHLQRWCRKVQPCAHFPTLQCFAVVGWLSRACPRAHTLWPAAHPTFHPFIPRNSAPPPSRASSCTPCLPGGTLGLRLRPGQAEYRRWAAEPLQKPQGAKKRDHNCGTNQDRVELGIIHITSHNTPRTSRPLRTHMPRGPSASPLL